MEIEIKSLQGSIVVDSKEVEIFVEEQLKIIPGIVRVSSRSFGTLLKNFVSGEKLKGVKINYLRENKIGIECHIIVSGATPFKQIVASVQEIVSYSVRKKYDLKAEYVDVHVKGIV